MKRTNYTDNDDNPALPRLKVRRVNKQLRAGDVSVHDAAAAAFSLWRDLQRQFPSYSLLKPEVRSVLLSYMPMQAIKIRDRWLVFGGFEAYTALQGLPSPTAKMHVEIQEFQRISRDDIESLSLAFPTALIEMHSLCSDVGVEQLRTYLKTQFSRQARDNVLACDPTNRERYSKSIGTSDRKLKRQAHRLRRSCSPETNFITDILEGLQHEEAD